MKTCPYCGEKIQDVAKKCRYCGERLEKKEIKKTKVKKQSKKEEEKNEKSNKTEKKLGLREGKTIKNDKIPSLWKDLSGRQKELLRRRFPISGLYRIIAFIFPGFFLLFGRAYLLFIFFLVLVFIFEAAKPGSSIIISIFASIYVCVKLESICYNGSSPRMKKCLEEERYLWDINHKKYNKNEEITTKRGWGQRLLLIFPLLIILVSIFLFSRLQSTQSISRDIARKNELNNIGDNLIDYYNNLGTLPGLTYNNETVFPLNKFENDIIKNTNLSKIPTDPLKNNYFYWDKENKIDNGEYGYFPYINNENIGFVLMAKTETKKGSNGIINGNNKQMFCENFTNGELTEKEKNNGRCYYDGEGQLMYFYVWQKDLEKYEFSEENKESKKIKELTNNKLVYGNENANISLIVFASPDNMYCKNLLVVDRTLQNLADVNNSLLNVIYTNYTLEGEYSTAFQKAEIITCAMEKGNSNNVYNFIEEVIDKDYLTVNGVYNILSKYGINKTDVQKCVNIGTGKRKVNADKDWLETNGRIFGIENIGIPTIIVRNKSNNRYKIIGGAYPEETFIEAINEIM